MVLLQLRSPPVVSSKAAPRESRTGTDALPSLPVLVVVLGAGLIGVLVAYIRKRRRTRRQGQRLGSTSDLVAPSMTDEMAQKPDSRASFLPTETFYSRDSRTSFATNSVSTHSRDYRNSFAAPSTFYTTSHSSDFTLDRDYDEDSISPFSDIHQPPHVRTATRDNLHSRPDSISSTFYSGPTRSSLAPSTLDGVSLLSERSPPSSTGATYGREHDFDDEDLISLSSRRSSRR